MTSNVSPPPEFESDEDRTHFLIRLPVHDQAHRRNGQVTPQVERVIMAIQGEMPEGAFYDVLPVLKRDAADRMDAFLREDVGTP